MERRVIQHCSILVIDRIEYLQVSVLFLNVFLILTTVWGYFPQFLRMETSWQSQAIPAFSRLVICTIFPLFLMQFTSFTRNHWLISWLAFTTMITLTFMTRLHFAAEFWIRFLAPLQFLYLFVVLYMKHSLRSRFSLGNAFHAALLIDFVRMALHELHHRLDQCIDSYYTLGKRRYKSVEFSHFIGFTYQERILKTMLDNCHRRFLV